MSNERDTVRVKRTQLLELTQWHVLKPWTPGHSKTTQNNPKHCGTLRDTPETT